MSVGDFSPAVDPVARKLLRTSATLLESADHGGQGCLRRVYFERVLGKPKQTGYGMDQGKIYHEQIETYLTTGQMVLDSVPLGGRQFIPTPGDGLIVERKIEGLLCGGLPFVGYVDVENRRGEYINPEGELVLEPGVVEIKDWKFTKDLVYAKSPEQVANAIQMTSYSKFSLLESGAAFVRNTHVYFQREKTPQARLVTIKRSREEVEKRWEYCESLARTLADVIEEPDVEKVPTNTKACKSYGKDCPHLEYCSAGKAARSFNSLNELFVVNDLPSTQVSSSMSTVDELIAEETQLRSTIDNVEPTPPEVVDAFALIGSLDMGWPRLAGKVASYRPDNKPSGRLGGLLIDSVDKLLVLAGELRTKYNPVCVAPVVHIESPVEVLPADEDGDEIVSITPPDMPASNPALEADPISADDVKPAVIDVSTGHTAVTYEVEPVKSKRGRPKKEVIDVSPAAPKALSVYLDTEVSGLQYKPLETVAELVHKNLCQQFEVSDIRTAPNDNPLGYGKWRGFVSTLVSTLDLDGVYVGDTRGNEILEIVAVSLRAKCLSSGGVFVRGRRS